MAIAAKASKQKRQKPPKRKKGGAAWVGWLLVIAGIAAAPVALHAASILALSGPGALTLLYPFVEIVRSPALRLPREIANPVAQWLMYLQFPLYGLFMAWIQRSRGFWIALNAMIFLYVLGFGAAWLLTHAQNPYLKF